MKKLLAIFLMLIMGANMALAAQAPLINQEEMLLRMEENAFINIFDVRDMEAFNAGHIPGAVSFPLVSLEREMKAILQNGFSAMDAEIIVYGEKEEDAFSAAAILNGLGFTNVSVLGALSAWTGELIDLEEEIARSMRLFSGFDTVDIYGNPVTDSILSGFRLTMVNVWATYCNPCISEMPELAKLHHDLKEQGVQIVGLLSDVTDSMLRPIESQTALARDIAEATGADYLHLLPDLMLYKKILSQVTAVPTTLFVDEQGAIVGYAYMGSRNYNAWLQIIEETLQLLPAEEEK